MQRCKYLPKKRAFKYDHRMSNPGLHILYTKWACKHLHTIRKQIMELNGFSNVNMIAVSNALVREYQRLVRENAAYADAHEILESMHLHVSNEIQL